METSSNDEAVKPRAVMFSRTSTGIYDERTMIENKRTILPIIINILLAALSVKRLRIES